MEKMIERIAMMAHGVHRHYCAALGDTSIPGWDDAPDWQRDSTRDGVRFLMANPLAVPADSHRNWLALKEREGWVYGPVKDPENKIHPCMRPYEELPAERRAKDGVFLGVVRTYLALEKREA